MQYPLDLVASLLVILLWSWAAATDCGRRQRAFSPSAVVPVVEGRVQG